ncbi:response regulator transcription factor [Streptomyces colonosanans]|uniref:response regulator transcription factor n=1 Tax=Streptomyces colonosanans TaxID=1428652 RepID=UPI0026AC664E
MCSGWSPPVRNRPGIAGLLHLSPGTVRSYLTAVVAKLDARNRTDVVRIAPDAGWRLSN